MCDIVVSIDFKVLDETFPDYKDIDKSLLKMTKEGLYSVSKNLASRKLASYIKKYMRTSDITITDGTANNGSDTLNLALQFAKVNSIEFNKCNFEVLENNAKVYNLENLSLYNGDSLEIIPDLTQDVIYIDAPWGGRDYKYQKNVRLYLGETEISEIYNKFLSKAKLIIFKVPRNYDFNFFLHTKTSGKVKIQSFYINGVIKFFFIFCFTT